MLVMGTAFTGLRMSMFVESGAGGDGPKLLLDSSAADWDITVNGTTGRISFLPIGGGATATTGSFKMDPDAVENLLQVGVNASDQVDVMGTLVITGTCTSEGADCASDFVFNPGYEVESIEDHAASMWENSYLPAVGPTPDNNGQGGKMVMNVFGKTTGMLNELEKAHIYIDQLNERLKAKASQVDALNERLARLEALVVHSERNDD